MAIETGVATDYIDLLYNLRYFLTGHALIAPADVTVPGGSDLVLEHLRTEPAVVAETITLTVSDDGSSRVVHNQSITNADFSSGDLTGWTDGANANVSITSGGSIGTGAEDYTEVLANELGDIYQDVTISGISTTDIDNGNGFAKLSWEQASFGARDTARIQMDFLDNVDALISSRTSRELSGHLRDFQTRTLNVPLPVNSRKIRIRVFITRYSGSNADGACTDFALDVIEQPLEFTVSGSTSGALGNAFEGEDYAANDLLFHLNEGAVALSVSDTVVFSAVKNELETESPSQIWEVLNPDGEWNAEQYFRGPGLSAADEIHVNIRNVFDTTSGYYNWEKLGATGYDSGLTFENQIGVPTSLDYSYLTLFDTNIEYWFVANGRRFIVIAKVSTIYATMYGGLILPYGTPTEYPYPLYVGGNGAENTDIWSSGNYFLNSFYSPGLGGALLRDPGGTWLQFYNQSRSSTKNISNISNIWPYPFLLGDQSTFVIEPGPDGNYVLYPLVLHSSLNDGNVYGELDGCFYITGQGPNVVEDIVTISAVDYLIIQASYRTGINDYAAIRLT